MPLGLFPREAQDLLAGVPGDETTPPPQPGFFAGAAKSIGSAILTGFTKLGAAITPPDKSLSLGMPPIGAPDWAYKSYEESQHALERTSDDEFRTGLANATTQAVRSLTPDPHTTGIAGQTLYGVASGLTEFLAGAAVGGPLAGAVAVGGSEGVSTQRELTASGVDQNTANALGAGVGLFSGAASLLPGGAGTTLAERVTTGAGIQQIAGVSNRLMMHTALDAAGYPQMAAAYQPFDGMALLSDAVLGAAFGAAHHAFTPRPSTVDAAHVVADAAQAEHAAPGPAVDPDSRTAAVDNVVAAGRNLLDANDTPPTLGDVQYLRDPAQEVARAARAGDAQEAAIEAGARPVAAAIEPEAPSAIVADTVARVKAETEAAAAAPPEPEGAVPLDPATAEAVLQAEDALTRFEGLKIKNEDGEEVDAAQALRGAVEDVRGAQAEGEWYRVAAACFGRA